MSENFYDYDEILDRNDRSIKELMQMFRISRGKYDFITQTLVNEPKDILSGISISPAKQIKVFVHQFVINKLSKSENLSEIEKNNIKDGFCYTLSMDWLFQKEQAELHYLPLKISQDEVENLWNKNGSENYYVPLAKRFLEYIQYTLNCQNKKVTLKGVYGYEYEDFDQTILFEMDKYFACIYNRVPFSCGKLLLSLDNITSIININKNINKALFRLIMHNGEKITRHTVAMQKVITADGQELYHFFDPNFGVYEIQNKIIDGLYSPLDFFNHLLGKYKFIKYIYAGGYVSFS